MPNNSSHESSEDSDVEYVISEGVKKYDEFSASAAETQYSTTFQSNPGHTFDKLNQPQFENIYYKQENFYKSPPLRQTPRRENDFQQDGFAGLGNLFDLFPHAELLGPAMQFYSQLNKSSFVFTKELVPEGSILNNVYNFDEKPEEEVRFSLRLKKNVVDSPFGKITY